MIKLLICLFSTLAIAAAMLLLRQQKLELQYEANQIHNQIERQQAKVWNQQLQIAIYTAPTAIQQTLNNHDLHLVTPKPKTAGPPGPSGEISDWDAAE